MRRLIMESFNEYIKPDKHKDEFDDPREFVRRIYKAGMYDYGSIQDKYTGEISDLGEIGIPIYMDVSYLRGLNGWIKENIYYTSCYDREMLICKIEDRCQKIHDIKKGCKKYLNEKQVEYHMCVFIYSYEGTDVDD